MSYCVNCGVELDRTAASCPLCNTPVVNPIQPVDNNSPKPFSEKRGQVDSVKHTDLAILLTVMLFSTAACCGILNLLVFRGSLWSLYIIGACILLWVFCIPAIIYTKLPWFLSILFDGAAVILYCGIVYYFHPGSGWYPRLAIPIILLVTALILVFVFLLRTLRTSILTTAMYVFVEIAVLNVGLELLIRRYLKENIRITWSAVVLICCGIISLALITIISRSRLREAVRRRMHM